MSGYLLERLYEEVAFIAYYFHWPLDQALNLDHAERRRWCEEISRLNQKINESAAKKSNES